ncbi:MAG: ABC transporter permease [Chryseobacterium sp.]|nr:MAG: ABC transporter permease [Chryseobacterium sp.]
MKNSSLIKNIKTLYHSCQVELIHFFSDSASYVTFLVLGIIVSFLYSTVYNREIVEKTPIAIVDMDNGVQSRNLIRMLDATQQVRVLTVSNNIGTAKKSFEKGEIYGILYIPNDFEKNITLGSLAPLSLYSDASNMLHNKYISTAISTVTGTFNAQLEINKSMHKGLNVKNSSITRRPMNAITKNLYNPYGGYATFLLPAVYLIIIQTLLLSAIGVLGGTFREQEKYFSLYNIIDDRSNRIIPVLLGRALAYLLLCIILFTIIGGCFVVFKLPFRTSIIEAILFLIPCFLSVIFLGFALMGIFKKREDAALSVTFTSIPAVFLTGISWPAEAFPHWVNILSYFFPTTVGVRGFLALSQYEACLSDIKDLWGMMWLTAIFYFLIAVLVNYKMKLKYILSK